MLKTSPWSSTTSFKISTDNDIKTYLYSLNAPPEVSEGGYFGFTTAISQDRKILVVGAPYSVNASAGNGGVFIYFRQNAKWILFKHIVSLNPKGSTSNFGWSCSLDATGHHLVVVNFDGGGDNDCVYYYQFENNDYVLKQTIVPTAINFLTLWSVALNADASLLTIGDVQNTSGVGVSRGAIYTFSRSGSTFTQQAGTFGSADQQHFGYALAITSDGNFLAVTSQEQWDGSPFAGFIQLYARSGYTWTPVGDALLNPANYDGWGRGLGLTDDGLNLYVSYGAYGAVSHYRRSDSTWSFVRYVTTSGASFFSGNAIIRNRPYMAHGDIVYDSSRGRVCFFG